MKVRGDVMERDVEEIWCRVSRLMLDPGRARFRYGARPSRRIFRSRREDPMNAADRRHQLGPEETSRR
jgi:hypothetical protein